MDFCLVCLIILVSHLLKFSIFGWYFSFDLLVKYNVFKIFIHLFGLFFMTCSATFFVSSSDVRRFRFTFVHTAKLKKSNFLNDFFLSR